MPKSHIKSKNTSQRTTEAQSTVIFYHNFQTTMNAHSIDLQLAIKRRFYSEPTYHQGFLSLTAAMHNSSFLSETGFINIAALFFSPLLLDQG